MKPYQKALVITIIVGSIIKIMPSWFTHKNSIEPGQVWEYTNSYIYNPGVPNDRIESESNIHVVYKVEDDNIYYVSNNTDSAFCDTKTFLYNSTRIK